MVIKDQLILLNISIITIYNFVLNTIIFNL